MGVIKRIKDIVNANVNAGLDKAEDPEKMIRYMISEMSESVSELKSSLIARKAGLESTVSLLKSAEEEVVRWGSRAGAAVEKTMDDLAREAIIEKKKAETRFSMLVKEKDHLEKIISETAAQVNTVQEKLNESMGKQRVLIQRGLHAKETLDIQKQMSGISGNQSYLRFSDFEKRIERMEVEAELYTDENYNISETRFKDMESSAEIEDELQALKKKVKK